MVDDTDASSPAPVIRAATTEDLDLIVSIVAAAYRSTGGQRGWTSEDDLLDGQRADAPMVQAILDDDRSVLLVAEVHGAVRGCIQLEPLGGDGAHFGLFAVDPTLQSGGVGGALLTAVEDLARQEWGCRWMQLEVLRQRLDLIAWYARRGYEPTGETQPFPYGDERFGQPRRDDLVFEVLRRPL
ncbi:MAG: GNAT family N-acetyltransferase [Aquihabitans sp.]